MYSASALLMSCRNFDGPVSTNIDPMRDETCVGACLDTQLRRSQVAIFVQITFVSTYSQPSASGQKVAAPGGQLCQLGKRSGSIGATEPCHAGIP